MTTNHSCGHVLENLQAGAAGRERPCSTSTLPVLSRDATDVVAIVLDQLADVLRGFRGVHSSIGNRAAEPYIVANEVGAARVLEELFDVELAHAESSVNVASVVPFLMVAH
jgi:hypothetical protein